jgi:hypothetical protein
MRLPDPVKAVLVFGLLLLGWGLMQYWGLQAPPPPVGFVAPEIVREFGGGK